MFLKIYIIFGIYSKMVFGVGSYYCVVIYNDLLIFIIFDVNFVLFVLCLLVLCGFLVSCVFLGYSLGWFIDVLLECVLLFFLVRF